MVKKNTIKAIPLLQQAIQLMGEDFALEQAKSDMIRALNQIQKIDNRRSKGHLMAEKYAKEAKESHKKWWEQVKQNAADFAKDNIKKDNT